MSEELTNTEKYYITSDLGTYFFILAAAAFFVGVFSPIISGIIILLGLIGILLSIDSNFEKSQEYIMTLEKRIEILEGKLSN